MITETDADSMTYVTFRENVMESMIRDVEREIEMEDNMVRSASKSSISKSLAAMLQTTPREIGPADSVTLVR